MRFAALLRAVNVGGRKVTMKELKEAAAKLGYANVRTLAASGNLVFDVAKSADASLEASLETAIEKTFGILSEVMVRNPAEWANLIKANPFPKKSQGRPRSPRLHGLQGQARCESNRGLVEGVPRET